jgi:indolepyruvate ferredoxin oxidoreductase
MFHAFRVLACLKRLRGTAFDPFGGTAERRMERQLLRDYETLLDELIRKLDAGNHGLAVELASLPWQVRGFGHVKQASVERARASEAALLERWRSGPEMLQAAE